MSTIYEQSKHLTLVSYQRLVRSFQPVLMVYGAVMSGVVLLALWLRVEAGQQISIVSWILGATAGLWVAMVHRLAVRLDMSRRRCVEFQRQGIFLSRRGLVKLRRFVSWSLSPDTVEPHYTRLRLTYKFGFGQKHWRTLLDDDEQIAALRHSLSLQIPEKYPTKN